MYMCVHACRGQKTSDALGASLCLRQDLLVALLFAWQARLAAWCFRRFPVSASHLVIVGSTRGLPGLDKKKSKKPTKNKQKAKPNRTSMHPGDWTQVLLPAWHFISLSQPQFLTFSEACSWRRAHLVTSTSHVVVSPGHEPKEQLLTSGDTQGQRVFPLRSCPFLKV